MLFLFEEYLSIRCYISTDVYANKMEMSAAEAYSNSVYGFNLEC